MNFPIVGENVMQLFSLITSSLEQTSSFWDIFALLGVFFKLKETPVSLWTVLFWLGYAGLMKKPSDVHREPGYLSYLCNRVAGVNESRIQAQGE